VDTDQSDARKTRTVYRSANPQWDEDFTFNINGPFTKCTGTVGGTEDWFFRWRVGSCMHNPWIMFSVQ
jgi:hypothetical protein